MLAIFLAPIYILLNIYVLRWGYLWIGNCHHLFQSRIFRIILTVIYTLIALTPLTGFLIRKPAFLHRILKITSNYFLGIFMYILMVLFSIDIVRLILKYAVHASWIQSRIVFAAVGACCICIVIIISFSGIYHAKHIKVTPYKITVDKSAPDMDSLKIVLLADTHFGYNSGAVHAQEIVDKINEQQPDLVCIAGDIFDNEYDAVREPEKISEILRTIRSKYGVYACWGNHDLNEPILAGFTFKHKKEDSKQLKDPRMKRFLQNSNIQLLEDEAVLIDNSFYVVGRKDASLIEKIEEKRNRQIKKDKNKKIAIATAGVATGAVVGTIAGVLIAPKSGKETIEDVKEKSNQVKNKINENIEDTKFKVKESKDKIKEYLAKRKNEKSENEIVEIEPLQLIENTEVAEENTEA